MNLGTSLKRSLAKFRRRHKGPHGLPAGLADELHRIKMLEAKLLCERLSQRGILSNIADAEFSVFSQFGEDGIIQYLLMHVKNITRKFIEFGVESYSEAATRFLLENNNWSGLIFDCDYDAMEALRGRPLYWRHDLTAVGAFLDCQNINDLFKSNGFHGDIGLLSIDIDGNDYWIWNSITCVNPAIVVIEYNSLFGPASTVAVPYDPEFRRARAHYSMLYWGSSLGALCQLAGQKGYSLVGCDSSGINAFFVRNDSLGDLKPVSPATAYVRSRMRQSRDTNGELSFLTFEQSQALISDMPVLDVSSGETVKLSRVFSPPK